MVTEPGPESGGHEHPPAKQQRQPRPRRSPAPAAGADDTARESERADASVKEESLIRLAGSVAALRPKVDDDVDVAAAVSSASKAAVGRLARTPIADLRAAAADLDATGDADSFLLQIKAEVEDVLGRLAAYAAVDGVDDESLKRRLRRAADTPGVPAGVSAKIAALEAAI